MGRIAKQRVVSASDEVPHFVYETTLLEEQASGAAAAVREEAEVAYRFATIGCCGEGSKAQRKVANWIKQLAKQSTIHQLHLVGDVVYPDGVSVRNPRAAQHTVEQLVTDYYGNGSDFQVCVIPGNHEPGCHGHFNFVTREQAFERREAFVSAVQSASSTGETAPAAGAGEPEEAPDSYFMPNAYYCQLIKNSAEDVVSIILHVDSTLLPVDEAQQVWLQKTNEWLNKHYPEVKNKFIMSHHSSYFTTGKRSHKDNEGKKNANPAAAHEGNMHQLFGRAMEGQGIDFNQWTALFAAHEHTHSVHESAGLPESIARHLPKAGQFICGNGGATSNKQDFECFLPGLVRTETGYGFTVTEALRDGGFRVKYYDCTDLSLQSRDGDKIFPLYSIDYDPQGKPIKRVNLIPEEGSRNYREVPFELLIHPKLLARQLTLMSAVLNNLKYRNPLLLKLTIAVCIEVLDDLKQAKLPSNLMENLFAEDAPLEGGEPEGALESKSPEPEEAGSGGAGAADREEDYRSGLDYLEVLLSQVGKIIHYYMENTYSAAFNQFSVLFNLLEGVKKEIKSLSRVGGREATSSFEQVSRNLRQFFMDRAVNPRHTKKRLQTETASDSEESDDEVEEVLNENHPSVYPVRDRRITALSQEQQLQPDEEQISRRQLNARQWIHDESFLWACLTSACQRFLSYVAPGELAHCLEYPREHPAAFFAVLLQGLAHSFREQESRERLQYALCNSVLRHAPTGLKDLLLDEIIHQLNKLDGVKQNKESVEARLTSDTDPFPFDRLFDKESLVKISSHPSLVRTLAAQAGSDNTNNLSRLLGKLQHMANYYISPEDWGYSVYRGVDAISSLFNSCRRQRHRNLTTVESHFALNHFFKQFKEARSQHDLIDKLTGERSATTTYFNDVDVEQAIGAIEVAASYQKEPLLQTMVEFVKLLPVAPQDYTAVQEPLSPWLAFYNIAQDSVPQPESPSEDTSLNGDRTATAPLLG